MKNIVKLVLFSGVFAFFAVSINSAAEAQGDPAGLCPDGKLRCASSPTQTWHKGNKPTVITQQISQ